MCSLVSVAGCDVGLGRGRDSFEKSTLHDDGVSKPHTKILHGLIFKYSTISLQNPVKSWEMYLSKKNLRSSRQTEDQAQLKQQLEHGPPQAKACLAAVTQGARLCISASCSEPQPEEVPSLSSVRRDAELLTSEGCCYTGSTPVAGTVVRAAVLTALLKQGLLSDCLTAIQGIFIPRGVTPWSRPGRL